MNQGLPVYGFDDTELFTRDFLLGGSGLQGDAHGLSVSVVMDSHKEGWVGIPHGGIGMGAMTEVALLLNHSTRRAYPFTADFRLGGTSARVSDTLHLKMQRDKETVTGAIHVNEEPSPYMKSEIRFGADIEKPEPPPVFLSPAIDVNRLRPLPIYKNCFVCGTERRMPGLKRTFHLLEPASGEKVVISTAGFESADADSFFLFRRGNGVHPVAFTALLDETLGWGGFMLAAAGAVTVRIHFSFFRQVALGEKIIFYGFGEKVRGKLGSRLLFWAKGGAVVVKDGALEPVATATGQWLALPELTRQMHENLMPAELTRDAFSHAQKEK